MSNTKNIFNRWEVIKAFVDLDMISKVVIAKKLGVHDTSYLRLDKTAHDVIVLNAIDDTNQMSELAKLLRVTPISADPLMIIVRDIREEINNNRS